MPKGFFTSLFDISFKSFITTRVISVLYVLVMVALGIGAIVFVAAGFAQNSATGVVFLILSPIGFIFYLLYVRVLLEVVVILFRIHDNTALMAGQARGGSLIVPGGDPRSPSAPEGPTSPGRGTLESFREPPPGTGTPPQGPQAPR